MGSLIRATAMYGFKELVQELGGDPYALMARWNLSADLARQPDSFFPYRSLAQILEAAAIEFDCPDIGLRLAQKQGLDALGPIAVIARNAKTIADAFNAITHYLHVHSPALTATLTHPPGTQYYRLRLDIVEPGLFQKRQVYELSVAVGMQILRLLGGPQSRLLAAFLPHAPRAPEACYRDMFGCRVYFEQSWCGYDIPLDIANKRIDTADPQTMHLAAAYLDSSYISESTSLSAQVREMIRRLLPTGQCNIETIAEQLTLHARTLQRRLVNEGTRYDHLLDNERRELAAHYLSETGLYLSQITALLGYAEQSTFNRACRRWFNVTPRQYRIDAASTTR